VLAAFAFPYNFAACFAAASICLLVSFLGLAAIHEPVAEERAEAMRIGAYIGQLPALLRRDRDFRIFIFVRVLSAFAGLATAFVAVYATEQRELPASIAGRFTAWMLGAQIIATPLFGMLADRYGYKPSLQFALLAQTVAMVLSLIVTTPLGFSIVFALIGAATGLVFATTLNMVVEFATPAQRVTYLGLHGTLIALPTLLAPVLGGWLVEAGGYPLAFIAAAIFGIAAFVLLTWFVRDPRHRQLAMATTGDVRSYVAAGATTASDSLNEVVALKPPAGSRAYADCRMGGVDRSLVSRRESVHLASRWRVGHISKESDQS
jgi:predicted MFS family arabinose efflux permease